MNPQRDELQELWRKESTDIGVGAKGPLPKGEAAGRAEASRLRRSVRRDGWLKIGALLFLGAALPLFAGRFSAAAWGVLGFSLLAVVLGIFQVAWSSSWRQESASLPLAASLAADLEVWRRRRPALAVLLGATPALAWQVYQLAYLALNPGRSGRLVNLLFLTAGGPLLWLLATWRQWARLEAWLLQVEGALAAFDENAAANYLLARRRATKRTVLIAALLLALLLTGTLLYWLAK
ncbi:MAG: hypothetical protein MUF02_09475 [Acidobacteria bacterium]|jgi:hypothetical protein|nr:hypothetical protein [Acidobacteriota bacterium]